MIRVEITEVNSRIGDYAVIKMGQLVLVSPCDTRTKILEALATRPMTGEELARESGVKYSCVMDHMDLLEKLGVVTVSLEKKGEKKGERRRMIHFHFSENPLEGIQELFMTATRSDRIASRDESRGNPSEPEEITPGQTQVPA